MVFEPSASSRHPSVTSRQDSQTWRDIARVLKELDAAARHRRTDDRAAAAPYESIVNVAAERIPHAEWVSITVQRLPGSFITAAASDPRAESADQVQYDLGSGPCVDAIVDDTIYCPRDLLHDRRWPAFGRKVAASPGARSMLSFRMTLNGGDLLGCLNVYATQPDAFDADAVTTGEMIATHAALLLSDAEARATVEQLRTALSSSREIGVAMGVLMTQHKLTRDDAFNLLRLASQNSNRKLRDIAADVADTGELSLQRPDEPAKPHPR